MMGDMLIDYSSQLDYLWALLPEAVLSAWAMLVLLVDVFQKGDRTQPSRPMIAWLALAGVLLAAAANGWLTTVDEVGRSGMIAIDAFRIFTNFLFLLAAALFVLFSTRYLEKQHLSLGELYVLILFATVGMMVFAGSRDLMVTFLGLELMSVPVYVLTGVNRRDRRSAEGALKYFLLGAFSSAFFLFGIALIYGGAGTINLAAIGDAIGLDGLGASPLLLVGMALLAVGFAFKVAAVPFHMWAPDAYEGAPAPITGFMAAAVKAAAFAAFLRVFLTAFPALYDTWDAMVVFLALATMIGANLVALVEGNVKRMLAYSSIAHAGYLLVAVAAASVTGTGSFLFYLVVYTLMTMGAFAILVAVGGQGEEGQHLEAYSGLGWERPAIGIAMTVFLLSLAGVPATGGFIGKFYVLQAAVEADMVPLAIVLVLASLISYFYYLRVVWYMWFRDAPSAGAPVQAYAPAPMRAALVVAAIAVVLLGIFPGALQELAQRSASGLLEAPAPLIGGL